ncbi:MAG: tetratricopeptide repeat protein [Hyphomicrobiales bacterium]|nr:tetratricopeptide repeat protein [Hyphomicrobiales bacterium]
MHRFTFIVAILLAVAGLGGSAFAQSRDLQACSDERIDVDSRIPACTRIIDSRQSAQSRALALAYRGAIYLRQKNDPDQAIADLDRAIQLRPDIHADFYQLRGSALVRKRSYAAAIASFDEAIRKDPRTTRYVNSRGLAYLTQGMREEGAADQGVYDLAIRDFSEAIRLAPSETTGYGLRADAYAEKGDLDRAIADYTEAIRLDPSSAQHLRDRGKAYLGKREYDAAIRDFTIALERDQSRSNVQTLVSRGQAYRAKGDNDRAILDFDAAIRIDPKHPFSYGFRSIARSANGDLDGALADAREYLKLRPRGAKVDADAYDTQMALGDLLREDAQAAPCVETYSRAIAMLPRPGKQAWEAHYFRGVCLGKAGEWQRAEADFKQALAISPEQPQVMNYLAYIWLERRVNVDEAMTLIRRAVELKPNDGYIVDSLGFAHYQRGEYDQAVARYERAVQLRADDADLRDHLGDAYWKVGRRGDAVTQWMRARTLDPDVFLLARIDEKLRVGLVDKPSVAPSATSVVAAVSAQVSDAAAAPARRVALVIGNSAYRGAPVLDNPRRDAAAIAAVLKAVGFQTVRLEGDLAREKLIDALRGFAREAASADWAVIYFAGHGLEVGGMNYLVPVDAKLESDRDVQYEAVSLEQVLGAVDGARRLRLVILDACRDHPFVSRMKRMVASRSIGRGLARVEPDGGTLVAYAAKGGEIALDGSGANSPFVSALVKHLPTPGLEIGKLFRQVRDDVLAATGRKQEPFVYGSLPGDDFFFVAQR